MIILAKIRIELSFGLESDGAARAWAPTSDMSEQLPSASVVPILLPQAGNSMEEGTILAWRVKVGDRIKLGDVIFDLETDKATVEVEAETTGRLARIVVAEGQTAPVKTPVAYLSESDDALETLVDGPAASAVGEPSGSAGHALPVPISSVAPVSRRRASPVARRAAEALKVDLDSIACGSGPDGRILLEDVEAAVRDAPIAKPPMPATAAPAPVAAMPGGVRTPLSKMRRAIAKNLSVSKQTLPHWYLKGSIDAEPLLSFYKREKALYPCSLNDVIVLAVSRVIMEMPEFRSQIDGDDLVQYDSVNIGIAVGMEQGLVVPVLKNADARNLKGIARESRRLIEAAKDGKVEGMGEAVFSISNLGMYGVEEFSAIINPPECAILAVGAAREEVVVKDGALRIGKKLTLVLSADHRIIDGTMSAKFMSRLKGLLEDPAAIGGAA